MKKVGLNTPECFFITSIAIFQQLFDLFNGSFNWRLEHTAILVKVSIKLKMQFRFAIETLRQKLAKNQSMCSIEIQAVRSASTKNGGQYCKRPKLSLISYVQ